MRGPDLPINSYTQGSGSPSASSPHTAARLLRPLSVASGMRSTSSHPERGYPPAYTAPPQLSINQSKSLTPPPNHPSQGAHYAQSPRLAAPTAPIMLTGDMRKLNDPYDLNISRHRGPGRNLELPPLPEGFPHQADAYDPGYEGGAHRDASKFIRHPASGEARPMPLWTAASTSQSGRQSCALQLGMESPRQAPEVPPLVSRPQARRYGLQPSGSGEQLNSHWSSTALGGAGMHGTPVLPDQQRAQHEHMHIVQQQQKLALLSRDPLSAQQGYQMLHHQGLAGPATSGAWYGPPSTAQVGSAILPSLQAAAHSGYSDYYATVTGATQLPWLRDQEHGDASVLPPYFSQASGQSPPGSQQPTLARGNSLKEGGNSQPVGQL